MLRAMHNHVLIVDEDPGTISPQRRSLERAGYAAPLGCRTARRRWARTVRTLAKMIGPRPA
jgi:hypothetical protein